MSRVCNTTGQIAFVGAGPGDAGMLTVRAQHLLSCAELLVTDPDVPPDVLALADPSAEVRPAVGEPGEV
ncbi:MAG: SAM-dependent methyltransferase, partial [Pseudonocardiaceae bacterium]